ncbi:hypothetical protein DFO70_12039 [Cytobacillus firmus]|uniref:Uncharacterized protein n=2 Tax=Cytobacillus TaxID=2675230 RepID=A0A366JL00_CYTFI|nr:MULTISPECIES: hypothetical protein [Cytobacillus]RBP87382.1 hypothetical protein DFO70_12039 [Cytobacillus firmus]TDX37082.1 hypothetical protein DFO72_11641 [Cytobacillus oceanisediminis]
MTNIQLSIEELIFAFYSEGLYEEGISMKETYFPSLQDSELKLMLEFAARSLLAKDMAIEVNNQYRLKENYKSYINILRNAERTFKASKFDLTLEGEENISFHIGNGEIYFHRLLHDHQVHYISKFKKEEILPSIIEFFNINNLPKQSDVLFSLRNEEFEEFLGDMSENETLSVSIVEKWQSRISSSFTSEFLKDFSNRKGKMDSLLNLGYDSANNPDLIDLYFVIPGETENWLITRDQNLDLNVKRVNETSIKSLFGKALLGGFSHVND